jgi:cytochrome c oxidase subunit 3
MTASDAHIHDRPDFLQHHFETPRQQFEAGKLGMWLFLATEVLLFGGLFCGYAVWRGNHPDLFKYGSQSLNTTLGAVNTVVLIASSLTMAAAVTMAQRGRRGPLVLFLALTLAGAATFLVIKYFEYTHKFHQGIYPGLAYYESPEATDLALARSEAGVSLPVTVVADLPAHEPTAVAGAAAGPGGVDTGALAEDGVEQSPPSAPRNAHMFYNIYFLMTGLHGLHVLAGGIVLGWLIVGAARGRFGAAWFTPVDLGGLYWHVVDLIWIFLFPLFYLI